MNLLFLTIIKIDDISDRGIYPDLMRKFKNEGHNVFLVTPIERRYQQKTTLNRKDNVTLLKIKTLNIQKTNVVEKLVALSMIKYQYLWGIKKYFPEYNFDLVIYSTPPITFLGLVKYIKVRYGASSYLLLKDIFPQNAVDLGLIKKNGLIHSYFLNQEKKLYDISDYIGCMSQANVDCLIKNHPEINPQKVEINPNSHELFDEALTGEQKLSVRRKYKIPSDATVFIYGGNLGKPQGISFVIDFLNSQKQKTGVFFVIVGTGTEFGRIKSWYDSIQPANMIIQSALPRQEYNLLLQSSDVGMIFLDNRFTIPNFPSRLLSYLEYKLPILAATDTSTDLGKIIVENGFGLWSESGDLYSINQNITKLIQSPKLRERMGIQGFNYFVNNYTVDNSYKIIIKHYNKA